MEIRDKNLSKLTSYERQYEIKVSVQSREVTILGIIVLLKMPGMADH